MENITKKDLMDIVSQSDNPLIQDLAKQKMQDEFEGDIVAQKMIQLSQLISQRSQTSNLDEEEIRNVNNQDDFDEEEIMN